MEDLITVGVVCIIIAAIPFLVINRFRAFSKRELAARFEQKPTSRVSADQNTIRQNTSKTRLWAGNAAYFAGGVLSAAVLSYLRCRTRDADLSTFRPAVTWAWMLTPQCTQELANSGIAVLVIPAIVAACVHYRYDNWRKTAKWFFVVAFFASITATLSNS